MLAIGTFGPTAARSLGADRYTPAAPKTDFHSSTIEDRVEITSVRAQEIEANLGPREEGQLLVKVSASLTSEQLKDLAADHGATLKQELKIPAVMQEAFGGKLVVLETGSGLSEAQTMALLEQDERILSSGTNDRLELIDGRRGQHRLEDDGSQQPQPPSDDKPKEKLPNDVHPEQWNIRNRNFPGGVDGADIQAGQAWTITTGKSAKEGGPVVAVIDSGIDAFHEDLKDNMWNNPRLVWTHTRLSLVCLID